MTIQEIVIAEIIDWCKETLTGTVDDTESPINTNSFFYKVNGDTHYIYHSNNAIVINTQTNYRDYPLEDPDSIDNIKQHLKAL